MLKVTGGCNPFFKGGYDPVPLKKDKPCAPCSTTESNEDNADEQYFISYNFFRGMAFYALLAVRVQIR